MFATLASAAAGYLIGTVPCADAAARLATGGTTDLRLAGTGNPGAVNAMHVLGKAWGSGILAADAAKGALACTVGRRLAGATGAHVAGTAALVGHCFPVWNGFRGGKGVAVSLGHRAATFPSTCRSIWGWPGSSVPRRGGRSRDRGRLRGLGGGRRGLWWRKGWPNAWGPEPTAALPLSAAVSSAVIAYKFMSAKYPEPVT